MKVISSAFITLALSVTSILALPGENVPEKRSSACAITGNGARCRRTPTSSDILGEFFIGQSPTFSCRATGPSENGPSGTNDNTWDRTTVNGVPCFVSDSLVAGPCPFVLPNC
ncbi:hypothetical protein DFH08DRAFT_1052156 [Mycena albidolilacea]|uniref:Uncharacterized protein n=1 Tax=Mycena albidolilacea TaxID=1033008 RepID=A0AAD7ACH3_9AGAR|nr:hypothetical protein DFH08DRAFT_1052156 [Mycena albidolilacea]